MSVVTSIVIEWFWIGINSFFDGVHSWNVFAIKYTGGVQPN